MATLRRFQVMRSVRKNERNRDYRTSRSGVHKYRTNTLFSSHCPIFVCPQCEPCFISPTLLAPRILVWLLGVFFRNIVRLWSRCYRANAQKYGVLVSP